MKKLFFIAIPVLAMLAFVSPGKNNLAEVDQMQGCYIFVNAKPVADYEYLGTVKSSATWSGQFQEVRDKLIKKAKLEYPKADGLIFNFVNGGVDKCDAVKFKE